MDKEASAYGSAAVTETQPPTLKDLLLAEGGQMCMQTICIFYKSQLMVPVPRGGRFPGRVDTQADSNSLKDGGVIPDRRQGESEGTELVVSTRMCGDKQLSAEGHRMVGVRLAGWEGAPWASQGTWT